MPAPVATDTRTHQLLARTAAVADHHHDTSNPNKPLFLLIPGGAIAVTSLLGAAWQVYANYVSDSAPKTLGSDIPLGIVLLLLLYFAGLFVFSYGYELYDLPKAIKLTIIAGLIGIAAVAIAIVCVYALGALASGAKGSKSSGSKSSGSSGSSSGGSMLDGAFGATSAPSHGGTDFTSLYIGPNVVRTAGVLLNNVQVNPGAVVPRIPTARPGCCPKCDQPIDPARALPEGTYLDENLYCPKCRQPYESVGLPGVDKAAAP